MVRTLYKEGRPAQSGVGYTAGMDDPFAEFDDLLLLVNQKDPDACRRLLADQLKLPIGFGREIQNNWPLFRFAEMKRPERVEITQAIAVALEVVLGEFISRSGE